MGKQPIVPCHQTRMLQMRPMLPQLMLDPVGGIGSSSSALQFDLDLAGPEKSRSTAVLDPVASPGLGRGEQPQLHPQLNWCSATMSLVAAHKSLAFCAHSSRSPRVDSLKTQQLEESRLDLGAIPSSFCSLGFVIAGQEAPPLPKVQLPLQG